MGMLFYKMHALHEYKRKENKKIIFTDDFPGQMYSDTALSSHIYQKIWFINFVLLINY